MTFDRSQRPSSTTAAAVSSQEVSMPRIRRAGRWSRVAGDWSVVAGRWSLVIEAS
jgi:hypothetical protein